MNRRPAEYARLKRAHNAYQGVLGPVRGGDELPWLARLVARLEELTPTGKYIIAATLIVIIGLVDWVTGPEFSFSIFYVLPVSMLGWYRGPRAALVGAGTCGAVWLIAETFSAYAYANPALIYWNALARTFLFLIIGHTLSQLRYAVEEEQRIARTDALTGIANNQAFVEACAYEVTRQRRYERPLSAAYLDCDNFKDVNDALGHAAGDELLRALATSMRATLRDVDLVARVGGDEFAILLPETDVEAAAAVCEKLRGAVQAAASDYGVTMSVGIVTYLTPPESAEDVIRTADQTMYDAKKEGKNAARHRVIGGPVVSVNAS